MMMIMMMRRRKRRNYVFNSFETKIFRADKNACLPLFSGFVLLVKCTDTVWQWGRERERERERETWEKEIRREREKERKREKEKERDNISKALILLTLPLVRPPAQIWGNIAFLVSNVSGQPQRILQFLAWRCQSCPSSIKRRGREYLNASRYKQGELPSPDPKKISSRNNSASLNLQPQMFQCSQWFRGWFGMVVVFWKSKGGWMGPATQTIKACIGWSIAAWPQIVEARINQTGFGHWEQLGALSWQEKPSLLMWCDEIMLWNQILKTGHLFPS